MKDSEQNHSMGSLIDETPPQSKDLIKFVISKTICTVTVQRPFETSKERKAVPGVEPKVSGLSHQCSETEPQHPPRATPPSFLLFLCSWVTLDENIGVLDELIASRHVAESLKNDCRMFQPRRPLSLRLKGHVISCY